MQTGKLIRPEDVLRALDIFLAHAWPKGNAPHCAAAEQSPGISLSSLFHLMEDESRQGLDDGSAANARFVLRIGNHLYPHMKFVVEQNCVGSSFYFMADSHDACLPAPSANDIEAWEDLRRRNAAIKRSIESAWEVAGLPTLQSVRRRTSGRLTAAKSEAGRILVVDDEPASVELTRMMLQSEGFGSEPAYSGQDALDRVKVAPPDMVLLDYMMPGMSGKEVAERLKSDRCTRRIPVLICTYAEVADSDLAPADAVLRRPFRKETLARTVRRLLSERETA